MIKICVINMFLIVLFLDNSIAQTNSEDGFHFDGYMLGTTIRQLDVDNILIADIPLIEARIPLYTDVIQFKYGGYLLWGITKFFVEWNYGTGIIFYPIGNYIGFSGNIRVGSFFFDNVSYTGAVGIHFDIPSGSNKIISIGCEYFYRNSRDLLNYISFPQYGASREKIINIDSRGIGLSILFRY